MSHHAGKVSWEHHRVNSKNPEIDQPLIHTVSPNLIILAFDFKGTSSASRWTWFGASLQSTNLSLMPEGLEAAISVEEMADLIAFLRTK